MVRLKTYLSDVCLLDAGISLDVRYKSVIKRWINVLKLTMAGSSSTAFHALGMQSQIAVFEASFVYIASSRTVRTAETLSQYLLPLIIVRIIIVIHWDLLCDKLCVMCVYTFNPLNTPKDMDTIFIPAFIFFCRWYNNSCWSSSVVEHFTSAYKVWSYTLK